MDTYLIFYEIQKQQIEILSIQYVTPQYLQGFLVIDV